MKFPFKLYGTKDNIPKKTSYMGMRILGYYGINEEVITNHLLKIYKGTLYSIADQNYSFMD